MLAEIKEKILKKRFAVPLLAFLSLFIFYPAKAAAAWFLPFVVAPIIMGITSVAAGYLAKALTALSLIGGVLVFGWALSRAFMGLGLDFLNWGISGTFFTNGMSMTNPANNAIIQIGWTLLRDLTNMFFILGLAYIGLATALNFASFNTKKTFTTLIIVALLINFTPVICGLIVDGTNIIMNFFLSEVNFNQLSDSYTGATKHLGEIQESALKENLGGRIAEYFLMSIYGIVAGSVLMIFGFILLMRHFIIWILVILSPLAFFLRIFDFSKQWYTKWWGWFVSWSFVGIPAAFFLYLANHLLIQTKTGQVSGADITTNGLGTALSPYLITVVFMVIALITTLKIKAAGSGLIMNTANKLATKAKTKAAEFHSKISTPMAKTATGKVGAFATGLAAGIGTKAGRANIGSAMRAGGSVAGSVAQAGVIQQREGQQRRAASQEKWGIKPRELEDISEEDLKKVASTPATTPDGMLRRAKAIKKLVDDNNFDFSGAQAEEMLGLMKQYPGMNLDKLKKSRPELAHLVDTKGYTEEVGRTATANAGTGISDNAIKLLARFRTTLNAAKKMNAEEIAKVPFKDFDAASSDPNKNMMLAAIFAGITPAKLIKIAEYGSAENLTAMYKFSDPYFPEFDEVERWIINSDPEVATIASVRNAILNPPLNVNFNAP